MRVSTELENLECHSRFASLFSHFSYIKKQHQKNFKSLLLGKTAAQELSMASISSWAKQINCLELLSIITANQS